MSTERRLETMLTSLGDSIDWPTPSAHLSTRVLTRIESDQPTAASRGIWHRPAIAAVAVVAVSLVFAFSPTARQAAADWLGAAGVRIGITVDQAPTTGAGLDLGELIQLDEVGDAVDFHIRVPGGEHPGAPDAVYLGDTGQITMVWDGTPTLPAAGDTGIGLLLTQSPSGGQIAEKSIGPDTGVQRLSVEGQPALWVEGATHTFTLLDQDGNPIEESTRLAANVLLWETNGVNHRLETTGDLQNSLTIVAKLKPIP